MVAYDHARLPGAFGRSTRGSFGAPVRSKAREGGRLSAVLRAAAVVMLLNFDVFPRLMGRSFLVVAVLLAVPLALHEILRVSSRARVVVFWSLLIFGILASPGILSPPQTEYGQQKLLLLVTLTMAAALAVALLRGRRDVEMFAALFALCGLVLAVAAMTGESEAGRASGFGSNPIWLGRAIGGGILALTWLCLRKRITATWAAGPMVLLFLGLFATGSRGPLLATVLALFVLVLAGLRMRKSRRAWGALALMGTLAMAVAAMPSLIPTRMYELVVDPSDELFDSTRATMREVTLPIIAEHPGGVGYGNWGIHAGMEIHKYPHNLWLELPAEAGWLVAGAFGLAVLTVVTGLWRAARRDPAAGFVLALVAFYAVAVSTSGDINGDRPLFAALALGVLVLSGATMPRVWRRPRTGRAGVGGRGMPPPPSVHPWRGAGLPVPIGPARGVE
ncbi:MULTISPECIES: O-antigen ligase family protein [unclassified Micromonospora]|uniref:O-antigen ligase family protein n=1 Tax=unclassified Micromonospora TaxID=2617518 RepID=UPI00188FD412|nr:MULTISPECIES: O-antigen ligase family protein [unclassified Micromonospora]MBF5030957.1 O-antigen ligase family protein [Micromonospora sp. ANENR4]MCZ7474325.1 O-antigen ligase family protein [Micromonospora sp. WMMC273]WBC04976.1 O-antigen ligase family protein [Micromonospora sp. WMMA1976]